MLILARAQNSTFFILTIILFSRRPNVLYLIRAAKARLQVLNWPNYGLLTGYKSKSVCQPKFLLAVAGAIKREKDAHAHLALRFQFGHQTHT